MARQLILESVAGNIGCPLLIIHGAKDTLLSLVDAQRLAAATTCPTELLVFLKGNHACNNIVYKVHTAADWRV